MTFRIEDRATFNLIVAREISTYIQLYKLFADIVYSTALSYTKITVDAEEITQDVFMKFIKTFTPLNVIQHLKYGFIELTLIHASIILSRAKERFH